MLVLVTSFQILLLGVNIYFLVDFKDKLYPKSPVVVSCSKEEIGELKRANDLLENLKNTVKK